jgi:hypothetical protein
MKNKIFLILSLLLLTSCSKFDLTYSEGLLLNNQYQVDYLTQAEQKYIQTDFESETQKYYSSFPEWSNFSIENVLYFSKNFSNYNHEGFILELNSQDQAKNLYIFLTLTGFVREDYSSVIKIDNFVLISNNSSQTIHLFKID